MIDKSSLSRVSQDQSGSQPNQKPNDSNGKPAKTWENNPPCRAEMNRVIGLKQHRFRAPAASLDSLPINVKTYAGSNHTTYLSRARVLLTIQRFCAFPSSSYYLSLYI